MDAACARAGSASTVVDVSMFAGGGVVGTFNDARRICGGLR